MTYVKLKIKVEYEGDLTVRQVRLNLKMNFYMNKIIFFLQLCLKYEWNEANVLIKNHEIKINFNYTTSVTRFYSKDSGTFA